MLQFLVFTTARKKGGLVPYAFMFAFSHLLYAFQSTKAIKSILGG